MNDIDDELRYEPLFLTACKSGDLEAVKELLKHGVDPLCEDEDEWNGFFYSAKHGHLEVFKAVGNAISKIKLTHNMQRHTFKAMDYAIREGHANIVYYVLEKFKSIDTDQWLIDDALHTAARYGQLEMAKNFIAIGANLHDQDNQSLRDAARYGHSEMVQYLLEQGADAKAGDSEALVDAARLGHDKTVSILLKHGADVHAANDDALFYSAMGGYANIVNMLLDNGADINAQERGAILWPARNGHNNVIDLYLKRGIDIFDQNSCPISEAIYNEHLSVAQNLIVNHKLPISDKSIAQLTELKENTRGTEVKDMVDQALNLIEKQKFYNKLTQRLSQPNPPRTTAKTKSHARKI